MKLNNIGYFVLTIGSIGVLAVGYAQSGGNNPLIPDHPIVTRPIPMKETGLFRDAATLWLTSNMENSGTVQQGDARLFSGWTVFDRTVASNYVNRYIYRHQVFLSAAGWVHVGGEGTLVRQMTATEHLASMIMFNRALTNRNLVDAPVADENGIRGTLRPTDVGLTSTQLMQMVEAKRQQQLQYLAAGSGGTP